MLQKIQWMDLFDSHILPPEGIVVKCLPRDKSRVINAYVSKDIWYSVGHYRIPDVRWWDLNDVYHSDWDVGSLQYPVAQGYLQEIINKRCG